jgi:hypothetical protein
MMTGSLIHWLIRFRRQSRLLTSLATIQNQSAPIKYCENWIHGSTEFRADYNGSMSSQSGSLIETKQWLFCTTIITMKNH